MAFHVKYSNPLVEETGYDDEPEVLTEYFEDQYDSISHGHGKYIKR